MPGVDGHLAELLQPLTADPRHGAIVCDIDGTLAPIAPRPELARVPAGTLELLERLTGIYALVACVTGRPAGEARRMVPVDAVAIAGNHGLEVWKDGQVEIEPEAAKYLEAVRAAALIVENDGLLDEYGCHFEDKGITFSVHFRNSPRADHAMRYLETQIMPKLERAGLEASFGRMVLEVRPPVPLDKGSGVRRVRGSQATSARRCLPVTTAATWTHSPRPQSRSRSARPRRRPSWSPPPTSWCPPRPRSSSCSSISPTPQPRDLGRRRAGGAGDRALRRAAAVGRQPGDQRAERRGHRLLDGQGPGARRHLRDHRRRPPRGDRAQAAVSPGAWRIPSGGIDPGESFEAGTKREALEETGLEIELTGYPLVAESTFTYAGGDIPWASHVVTAEVVSGELAPRDRVEIEDARWAGLAELTGPIADVMRSSGNPLFEYRADLHDLIAAAV